MYIRNLALSTKIESCALLYYSLIVYAIQLSLLLVCDDESDLK